ncbi:MAG: alpha/beta fold hydrolase [Crocinitomicaceae bacterium]|nr:alpha/beta fold hydrolase [Crocinitomicaceae bacterium]
MYKLILPLVLIGLLESCAFDKQFLNPYKLTTEDSYSDYIKEIGDSITMTFNSEQTPVLKNSEGQNAALSYSIENITFKSQSENNLNAWLMTPKENYNGITIYFLHGNSGHMVYMFPLMTPFVNAGYQVFAIDYSGFGFSDGEAMRKNVLVDGNSGLDYLLSREDIKHDKLIIYGQSLGGHLACVVASENEDKIDGLVVEGAFSSHKDISSDIVPILARIFVREMYSAKKAIQKYKKPLLVIHSTEDTRVKYKHGKRIFNKANEPKTFLTIDQKHIRGPLFYPQEIVSEMKKLLAD